MSSKLTQKFALAFILAALILFLAINVVTDVYTNYLVDVTESMQQELLLSHAEYLSGQLRVLYDVIYRLSIDDDIRLLLYDMDDAFLYSSIQAKLWTYRSFTSDVVSISVVNDSGTIISFAERLGRPGDADSIFADKELYDRMIRSSQDYRHVRLFPDTYNGSPVIHMVLGIKDYYTQDYICTAVVTASIQKLNANIRMNLAADGARDDLIESMIVINETTIAAHSNPDLINSEVAWVRNRRASGRGYYEVDVENRPDLRVISTPIDKYGTCLISTLDKGILLDNVNGFRRLMLLGIVAVVVGILAVEFSVLLRFSRNLKILLAGMSKVEKGSFDTVVALRSKDELRTIADHFNHMTARLKESSERQARHNQELLLEEEKLREAEVKALESQINSHFLYNVLNIINFNVMDFGSGELSHMIKALSETLYFTFNKSMRSVRVKHEVDWLRQYLYLQQECHGKLFTFTVTASPDTLELPIKKLLVQPFAENSIAHGFYGRSYGGHIDIRFRRLRSGRLAITVGDNGCGMPKAKVERIRMLFASCKPQERMGVGIENIVFRIRRYYRNDARIHIESTPFVGTKITVILGSLQE